MRNILLLISMLGLLPAGCGRTVSDTDTVSCDTFVYSVKGCGSTVIPTPPQPKSTQKSPA